MNTKKLQELILYIAHKSHDDPYFSSTKLNKILFLADFMAYGFWGESITGATYVHRQFGPAPQNMLAIQEELESKTRAVIEEREFFTYRQKRLTPLANPDLTLFTPNEIRLVHDVLEKCNGLSATQLSDMTHELPPWLDADDGEEIPYETVFILEKVPVGRADIAWAEQALDEIM